MTGKTSTSCSVASESHALTQLLDVFHKRLVDESKVYEFGRHLIIHALYTLSTEHMKKQFPKDIPDGEESDQDVVHHLARNLFRFSYGLVELRSTVTHGTPCLTVNADRTARCEGETSKVMSLMEYQGQTYQGRVANGMRCEVPLHICLTQDRCH
eukprot:Blabericola_migrator_1__2499@NODE_1702_length_3972_cov_8_630474_g1102_i0_p4_GENE_NODE_1702_length_3972_cov_8_630474_g1102_i0NODE_1702_length_3972_cov_8_630474_g1102_i0_p4_ORF_typecomplete_len155_score14_07_NODE_1702_length_3972_cov_8_630474_g1102_i031963660